jgi:hypothetical protein
MAKQFHLLTAKKVSSLPAGRHADGGNLYLVVSESGARKWSFLYRAQSGKQREMGLGPAGPMGVSLASARDTAAEARDLLFKGVDPLDHRRETERRTEVKSFGAFADDYIAIHETSWKSETHRAQWRMTLTEYAAPLRAKRLDQIDADDIVEVLNPIWLRIPETARRLRGRIEAILDAAKAVKLRQGDNPAMWKGNLQHRLPKQKGSNENHFAAMEYVQAPDFVAELRKESGISQDAFEFLILTATRTAEVRLATFDEFNLDKAIWTIPGSRMKAERQHRVPLSPRGSGNCRQCRFQAFAGTETCVHGAQEKSPALQHDIPDEARKDGVRAFDRAWVPFELRRLGQRGNRAPVRLN